jgi:hypothetical protein
MMMDEEERRQRTLTDADIAALTKALTDPLSEALRKKWITTFYQDLGKGIWALAWRAILLGILAIAAYGAIKGSGFHHIDGGQ